MHEQDQMSTKDPDSTYATKGGTPARLGYYDNYLVDNDSCVIVRVKATPASPPKACSHVLRSGRDESRNRWRPTRRTETGSSCSGWRIGTSPYMRTRDSIHRKNSPFYGPERFTYQPESNRYICPAGQPLNYGGRSMRNRTYAYIGTRKRCGGCVLKTQCTSAAERFAFLPSTWMSQPGNAHASWRRRQSSPTHSGTERKWKPCSRN